LISVARWTNPATQHSFKSARKSLAFVEKENRQPKTQPSGNMPPPRPPTRTAIGMLPGDEDPESNRRRRMRREIVQINLPTTPLGKQPIQLPLLPAAPVAKAHALRPSFKERSATWPNALLLILSIWAFIGALVSVVLYSIFSANYNWDLSRSVDVILLLFSLWVIFRCPKLRALSK
jgi:hypothetical protein